MNDKTKLRLAIIGYILLFVLSIAFLYLSIRAIIGGYEWWSYKSQMGYFEAPHQAEITLGIFVLILSTILWSACIPALFYCIINTEEGGTHRALKTIAFFSLVCTVFAGSEIACLAIYEGSGPFWAGQWFNDLCLALALITEVCACVLLAILIFVKKDWSKQAIWFMRAEEFVLIGIALLIIVPTFIPMLRMLVFQ